MSASRISAQGNPLTLLPSHRRGMVEQSSRPGTTVDEEGGLYITREQLEKFGEGNSKWARRELRAFLTMDRAAPTSQTPRDYPKAVRIAGSQDDAAILELLLVDLRENAAFIAPIDEDRVKAVISRGTNRRNGYAGVIDGADGKLVAVTILVESQWWWSSGWYLEEAVTYVHSDHRHSHHSDALMTFGEWVTERHSKAFGYQIYFMCGVLGLTRFWAKTAKYRRKYMQVGSAFLYPSPNGGMRP